MCERLETLEQLPLGLWTEQKEENDIFQLIDQDKDILRLLAENADLQQECYRLEDCLRPAKSHSKEREKRKSRKAIQINEAATQM